MRIYGSNDIKFNMRVFTVKRNFLLFILLLFLALLGCQKETRVAREGDAAPDFGLESISGDKVRLSELRGKVVLVNFWASWCPPCREEIPSLFSLNAALSGKNFRMLAVAIDEGGRETIENFFRKTGVSLPALFDPGGHVGKLYGITGVPETFVIDKRGTIRKKIVGPVDWANPEMIRYFDDLASN